MREHARISDDQRDVGVLFIDERPLEPEPVRACHFAVVRGEDDQGVVGLSGLLERVQHFSDPAVNHEIEVIVIVEIPDPLLGCALAPGPGRGRGLEFTLAFGLALEVVVPIGRKLVDHRGRVFSRRAPQVSADVMGVQERDHHEPRPGLVLGIIQPIDRALGPGTIDHAAGTGRSVRTQIFKPVSGKQLAAIAGRASQMPLAGIGRGIARAAEDMSERWDGGVERRLELQTFAGNVGVDSVLIRMQPGEQAGAAGRAGHRGGEMAGEFNAARLDAVDAGQDGFSRKPFGLAHLVNHDQQHVGTRSLRKQPPIPGRDSRARDNRCLYECSAVHAEFNVRGTSAFVKTSADKSVPITISRFFSQIVKLKVKP